MSWHEEFGAEYQVPSAVLRALDAGQLEDRSWHNDVCPSFAPIKGNEYPVLWVEHPDPTKREMPGPRYTVVWGEDEGQCQSTDDVSTALRVLQDHA